MSIQDESLLTMAEATKAFPNRPSLATLHRWCQKGSRGVKLESFLIGSYRYTSHEAIQRFIERCNQSPEERASAALAADGA